MRMGRLILERLKITPQLYVYMSRILIYAEFRNDSDDEIIINSVVCSFQTEKDLPRHEIKSSRPISVPPGSRESLTLQLDTDLELRPSTNSSTVEVEYASGRLESETATFNTPVAYLDIQRIPLDDAHFFISHKIPEDNKLAERLDYYLQKIGFTGYTAEGNPLLGHDLWNEKIYPEIDSCVGLIVLWTAEAERNPESICKEIEHAKEKGKRTILLREENTCIPDGLQDIEHHSTNGKTGELDLVKLVRNIYHQDKKNLFKRF